MPSPPAELSDRWRGVIWMDQGGFYGHSDLSEGSGSLAMSFGGAVVDLAARTARVSNTGPSWSVENNPSGYQKFFSTAVLKYSYLFEFNEDYTFAQIYPSVQPLGGFLGTWYVPKALMSFTMSIQDTTGVQCPPPPGASKRMISRCAKYDRKSTYFDLIPSWSRRIGAVHYPVFEIVDAFGGKMSAYDAYVQWANLTGEPSGFFARLFLNLDLDYSGCGDPANSLLGR